MNTHMTKERTSEMAKMSVTRELLTFVGAFQPFGMLAANSSGDSTADEGDETIADGCLASSFGAIVGSQCCW
jgi:hypothetical protein